MTKVKKNKNNALRFFLVVVLFYLCLAVFNFELFKEAINSFFSIVGKIIPLLGLVFIVMVVVNKFLTADFIGKHLGEKSGIKAYFYSVLAGIVISGPPYALFPLLKTLKKRGMKEDLIAVLLYNRNIKIQFFPAMIYYFGTVFTIVISFYIIIFSVLSGMIVKRIN